MSFERVDERIKALELKMDGLQAELNAANRKAYQPVPRHGYRLAEVTSQTTGNTFTVKFVDGLFSQAAGTQTPSYKSRQITGNVAVHNLAGNAPAYGTKLLVFNWSHRWWTYWSEGGGTTPPPPQEVIPVEWQNFYWQFNGNNWFYETDAAGQGITVELYNQTNRRAANYVWGTNPAETGTPSQWGVGNTLMFSQRGTTQPITAAGSLELTSTTHPQESYYLCNLDIAWGYWRTSTGISAPSPLQNLVLNLELRKFDGNGTYASGVTLGQIEATPTDSDWTDSSSPFLYGDTWRRSSFTVLMRTIPVISSGVQQEKFVSLRAEMMETADHTDIAFIVNNPRLTFIRLRPHANQIA